MCARAINVHSVPELPPCCCSETCRLGVMSATDGGWKDQGPAPASLSSRVPVAAFSCVWTSFPYLPKGMQNYFQGEFDPSKLFSFLQPVNNESPPFSC